MDDQASSASSTHSSETGSRYYQDYEMLGDCLHIHFPVASLFNGLNDATKMYKIYNPKGGEPSYVRVFASCNMKNHYMRHSGSRPTYVRVQFYTYDEEDGEYYEDVFSPHNGCGVKIRLGGLCYCTLNLESRIDAGKCVVYADINEIDDEEDKSAVITVKIFNPEMSRKPEGIMGALVARMAAGKADAWLIGSDGPEHKVPCLRCVLMARSPAFDSMLTSDSKEKETGEIVITDYDSETLGAFWNFLLSNDTSSWADGDEQLSINLLALGDRYFVQELKDAAEKHLEVYLEEENAVVIFELASKTKMPELEGRALKLIGSSKKVSSTQLAKLSEELRVKVIEEFQSNITDWKYRNEQLEAIQFSDSFQLRFGFYQ